MDAHATPEVYTAIIRSVKDDQGIHFQGRLQEFGRSVISEGATPFEALKNLYENGEMLIADILDDHEALPEVEKPHEWETFSGKVTLRMPKSLHWTLNKLARAEGMSLNALMVSYIGERAGMALGRHAAYEKPSVTIGAVTAILNVGQVHVSPAFNVLSSRLEAVSFPA